MIPLLINVCPCCGNSDVSSFARAPHGVICLWCRWVQPYEEDEAP